MNTTASPRHACSLLVRSVPADGAARLAAAVPRDVPVDGGSIRVLRLAPRGSEAGRPVVFVAGWGAVADTFGGLFAALSPSTDLHFVETREKPSSRLDRRLADFSMDRFADDLARVLGSLPSGSEPVLMGTCFGSAIILHGLSRGIVSARTVICVDPMARLWVPRWVLSGLGPVAPAFVLEMLRPLLRDLILAGMREPVQRARSRAIIGAAEPWKWRRAAIQTRNWSLFDQVGRVGQRVYVVSGSHDRFHDSSIFPRVAAALKHGVLVLVPVGEDHREALMGAVASIFSHEPERNDTPEELVPFVSY